MSLKIEELLGRDAPGLRPRKSLATEAADALRNLILLEKIEPGAPIAEREVAEALHISRTPLREAMRMLENEGLIEYSSTRRPRVADPSLEELAQNLLVLGAIEAIAGECACKHASEEELDAINQFNLTMFKTSDCSPPLEYFKVDMAFHRAIVLASRNPPLIETHRQYNARLWRARFISSVHRPDRDRALRQHDEIARALMARKKKTCAKALRGHLETSVVNISISLKARERKAE